MRSLLLICFVATVAFFPLSAQAYITSYREVPAHRQLKWLKEMTNDFCTIKPGQLSSHQISQAPELMWAWSHTPKSSMEHALAVESLVKRLVDERRAGNRQVDVTTHDYNYVLEGWARSGAGEAAAERCEQILYAMQQQGGLVQPNLSSFKAVLMAWRQTSVSYAPRRAQRILEWMIQLYKDEENKLALPDADCFDIVLQVWSRSGHEQAPKQTEHILGVMERLYESTGLLKLKPRTTSFNAVLSAWAKSGLPHSTQRAVDIMQFMHLLSQKHLDTTVTPDSATYSIVVGALAKYSDIVLAAKQADAVLRYVEQAYHRNKDTSDSNFAVPDTILFNTVMGLWSKSNVSKAYRKARSILDRQTKLYELGNVKGRPDVYGYTSVIAACATETDPDEQPKAWNEALRTFQELRRQEDGPNHVSYGTMLKACAKLAPRNHPNTSKWVRKLFAQCCEDGCVGDMVLSRLREAASAELYKDLMQGYTKKSLPAEWTRNVNEVNDYRRKKSERRKRAEV